MKIEHNDAFVEFLSEADTSDIAVQKPERGRSAQTTPDRAVGEGSQRSLWRWHPARGWLAASAAVGLSLGISADLLFRELGDRERMVMAPAVGISTGQAMETAENPSAAGGPAALSAADGADRVAGPHIGSAAKPAKPPKVAATARPGPGVAHKTGRQPVQSRSANAPRTTATQLLPSARFRGLDDFPPIYATAPAAVIAPRTHRADDEHLAANTIGPSETTPAPSINVPVSADSSDPDGDELTFRWSAPVGTFADPTKRQTTFVCPNTPQPVAITVTVTDSNGATASDTIVVRCVESAR